MITSQQVLGEVDWLTLVVADVAVSGFPRSKPGTLVRLLRNAAELGAPIEPQEVAEAFFAEVPRFHSRLKTQLRDKRYARAISKALGIGFDASFSFSVGGIVWREGTIFSGVVLAVNAKALREALARDSTRRPEDIALLCYRIAAEVMHVFEKSMAVRGGRRAVISFTQSPRERAGYIVQHLGFQDQGLGRRDDSSTPGPIRRPTIRDVAELAGVSIATVSRALSSPYRLSQDARERVLTAARELGFSPSQMAFSLRLQRPGVDQSRRSVSVLFATNRVAAGSSFSGERSGRLTYGAAKVTIPDTHRFGHLELPFRLRLFGVDIYSGKSDPASHFTISEIAHLDAVEWSHFLDSCDTKDAIVFVHGFNTTFDRGLLHFAQVIWDLQVDVVPILFSWPSRGDIAQYLYDRESALASRDLFLETLSRIALSKGIERIHILAHSMGNLVALDALAMHPHTDEPLRLAEIVMAAPDVDRDLYSSLAIKVARVSRGMTLYASSADKALALSKTLAGAVPRAGDVPAKGPVIVQGVDAIDVTALGDDIFGLNHATYGEARSILNDVGALIRTGRRPPHHRLSDIRGVPEGDPAPTYWRYAR